MKTERTQIHFLSDVLVAVVSLDLKVPNDTPNTAAMIIEHNFWFCFGLSVPWRFFLSECLFFLSMTYGKKVALGSKMPFYVLYMYFLLSNLWGCWGSIKQKIKEACESTLRDWIKCDPAFGWVCPVNSKWPIYIRNLSLWRPFTR